MLSNVNSFGFRLVLRTLHLNLFGLKLGTFPGMQERLMILIERFLTVFINIYNLMNELRLCSCLIGEFEAL
jgi:hypothetical protein